MATNKNFEVKNGLTIAGTERISSAGAFTGSLASTTTATTQSAADSSTKIATTAYTDAAITALIGGAPSALNDLNELAAAIADDANYSTTLTTALATKLPLAGGTMTGNLTVNAIVDADNFKINNAQGTDGQLLTSTGSGVAWEDAPASGPTFKTFGTSSIMVGDSTTGTINAADYNTGLGVDVFANLTSGDQNTAIGFEAGNGITTQGQNTLIGYQAGKQVGNAAESWEAQRNTFIGFGAGRDVDEGQKAIAIGYYAMMSSTGSTTGDIAIGYQAMQYRASNSGDSIAIGSNAHRGDINQGYQNANRNVAIGNNALSVVETGAIQNTVVGWWAGQNVTTGPNNTLIGSEAGQAVSTGQLNTLLGYRAGELITTGNYNIVLGSYDGNEGGLDIRTASNRVVISDGAGNIRMYIDNTGKVGINDTNPSQMLSVSGTGSVPPARFTAGGNTNTLEVFGHSTTDASTGLLVSAGTSASDYAAYFRKVDGTTPIMMVRGNGNVGIGTTSPAAPLDVKFVDNTNAQRWSYGSSEDNFYLELDTAIPGSGVVTYNFNTKNNGTLYNNNLVLDRGNVGIGTTAPSTKLHVDTETDNAYGIRLSGRTNNGSGVWTGIGIGGETSNTKSAIIFQDIGSSYSRGKLLFCVNNDQDQSNADPGDARLTIQNDGNVGIGTTAPGRVLDVSHSAGQHIPVLRLSGMSTSAYSGGLSWYSGYGPKETAEMHSTASGSQGGEWWLNCRNQNSNAQSRVMAINNVGRLRLSGLSEACSGAFNVMGEVGNSYDAIQFYHNSMTLVGRIRTAAGSTSYNTSSDYRLKENVDYTWDATTRLKQLKPARFNFIADDTNTLVDGFLAHEVSSIVPEAITGTKDAVDGEGNPDYQGIDQSKLVPLLVKTIQELEARIATLEG